MKLDVLEDTNKFLETYIQIKMNQEDTDLWIDWSVAVKQNL